MYINLPESPFEPILFIGDPLAFRRIQGQNELFEVDEVVVVSIKAPENEMNISLKDIIYVST